MRDKEKIDTSMAPLKTKVTDKFSLFIVLPPGLIQRAMNNNTLKN